MNKTVIIYLFIYSKIISHLTVGKYNLFIQILFNNWFDTKQKKNTTVIDIKNYEFFSLDEL